MLASSLPWLNAALFAAQLVLNANQNALSPKTWPNDTPDIPIAPAGYAFLIWLVIYFFTAVHVFTDCFYPHYSIYEAAEKPAFLRPCFAASCVLNMAWIVLNNWLQWINVGTVDLILLTLSLLPIYVFLSRESLNGATPSNWRRYFASALAIRLYFSWICAATLLCITVSLQDFHGAYLSFEAYGLVLALLFVIALSGVVFGNDPVIGLVATWALVGLARKDDTFPGETQHVFELLQASAQLVVPVLPVMIVLSTVRQRRAATQRSALATELMKPIGSYQQNVSYGTNNV